MEGEKHGCVFASCAPPTGDLTWPASQACALTGNETSHPLVLRPALNPLSHTSQGQDEVFKKEVTSFGLDVKYQNFCAFLVGIKNGAAAKANSLTIPEKIKHGITI